MVVGCYAVLAFSTVFSPQWLVLVACHAVALLNVYATLLTKLLLSRQVLNRPSRRDRILKRVNPVFTCYDSDRSTLSRERINLFTLIVLIGKLRGHWFGRRAVHILLNHKLDSVCFLSCVSQLNLFIVFEVLLLVAASETILDWQGYHRLRLLFDICLLAILVELPYNTNFHYLRLKWFSLSLDGRNIFHQPPTILMSRV